jgi:putative membrane protein
MSWFWIWPTLVLTGLVLLGYLAFRLTQGRGTGSPAGRSSPRQILDERYARGEIDDQEYTERRTALRQ